METRPGAGQREGAGGRGGEAEPSAPGSRAHHGLAAGMCGPPAGDLRAEEPGDEPAAGARGLPADQPLFQRGLFFCFFCSTFLNSVVSEQIWPWGRN